MEPGKSAILTGLGGQRQSIVVVPTFADPMDSRNEVSPEGSPGRYKVVFVLSRPGFALSDELNIAFSSGLTGNSHLAVAFPALASPAAKEIASIALTVQTETGPVVFRGEPNSSGFLSKITTELDATAFAAAARYKFVGLASLSSQYVSRLASLAF